jgi:hypothetical protein
MDRYRVRSSTAIAATTAFVGASLFVGLLPSSPVVAAPPSNDVFGGASSVAVGFSESLNTTEATTDSDDQDANANCGAPATDASVWYAFAAGDDGGVIVDVSGSDYSAGVIVVSGAPGSFEIITCGPGAVAFFASAGSTYHVLAFDDQLDGVGTGGSLQISFNAAPPPPAIDVTVNPTGRFNKNGTATLSGTFTCENADFVDVFGDVSQAVGRFTIRGFFGFFAEGGSCDGTPHDWTADVTADNGKFKGGKSVAVTFSFACGIFECADGFSTQIVNLKGGR